MGAKRIDLITIQKGVAPAQSISSSVNNQKQKGKSYLKLAGVEFDFREFVPAKGYYDSALAVLPPGYPGTDTLQERVEVLGELVLHYNEVKLQDSLQAMYGMSETALRKKFEDYIEEKKRREEEAARQAEIAALNAAQNAALADAGPVAGQGSGKWYFTIQPSVLRGWQHIKGPGEIVCLKTIGDKKTSL